MNRFQNFLLLIFCLFFSVKSIASHLAGGEIFYRYIGDSTGIADQYEVTLKLYRDIIGATLAPTASIYVSSSCFGTKIVYLKLKNSYGEYYHQFNACDSLTYQYEKYVYKGTVELLGKCSDYTFYYSTCCRPVLDNLIFQNDGFYVYATLNNNAGNNNSALQENSGPRSFCVGKEFNWNQNIYDPDLDSIFISTILPKDENGNDLTISAGYAANQPVMVDSAVGFNVNPNNGNVFFKPINSETCVMTLKIEEYKWDTIYNVWGLVSQRVVDRQMQISADCSQWINTSIGFSKDTSLNNYMCGAKSIHAQFNTFIETISLDTNGSDLAIIDPDGSLVPVLKVLPDATLNFNKCRGVNLLILDSLTINGTYTIISLLGADGNTLYDECGNAVSVFDSLQFTVSGCSGISVKELMKPDIRLSPNPVTNILQVKFDKPVKNVELTVFDISGNIILVRSLTKEEATINIDLSHFKSGMYTVCIKGYNTYNFYKIIKH